MKWQDPGWALITGASSGIGAEFARQLAAQGFNLMLVARRKDALEKIAKELEENHGIVVEVFPADLADPTDVDRVAERIRELDNLDILINNAGFGIPGGILDCDFDRMMQMIHVHDLAPVVLSRTVLPAMKTRKRGAVVFTASLAAFAPSAGMYSPTKAFLVMLAECLDIELFGTGIRVQALCPGFTHTEFHDSELTDLRKSVPKIMWGTMDNVVRESLAGLRKKKVIVVPGLFNRFIWKCIPLAIKKRVTRMHK